MIKIGTYDVEVESSVARLKDVLNNRPDARLMWFLNTHAEQTYPGMLCLSQLLVVCLNALRDESGAQLFQAEVGDDPHSSCAALIIQPVSQAFHH